MKRQRTALDYAARIQRVVDHIADNLDGPLDLDRLAEVACFSRFHFHRVYRGLRGETPDQTVRRLRLHRAAAALSLTDVPISRIAAAAGYGSVEAFTRAFSAAYEHTPTAYRAARHVEALYPTGPSAQETVMYEVEIKTAPARRIAGLPHQGAYAAIGRTFEKVSIWAAPRGLLGPDVRMIGVYLDDPDSVPEAELRSFAGLTVSADFTPEGGVEAMDLPESPVAALIHKGPYSELEGAYRHLYGVWLPQSGREPADRPPFETYLNDPASTPPMELLTEVCVPIAA